MPGRPMGLLLKHLTPIINLSFKKEYKRKDAQRKNEIAEKVNKGYMTNMT
jgi:hypothetical protein